MGHQRQSRHIVTDGGAAEVGLCGPSSRSVSISPTTAFRKIRSSRRFEEAAALAYGALVASLGFSRRNAADRMIAAHAQALGAMVVTGNARDLAGVGVSVEPWRP